MAMTRPATMVNPSVNFILYFLLRCATGAPALSVGDGRTLCSEVASKSFSASMISVFCSTGSTARQQHDRFAKCKINGPLNDSISSSMDKTSADAVFLGTSSTILRI
ncbi:hypothetical protein BC828DRAFT_103920 [Blastocladiella britannica]|nr:hypothetical protein BC828DRAFT_103920 [Blastocladiella britannica]